MIKALYYSILNSPLLLILISMSSINQASLPVSTKQDVLIATVHMFVILVGFYWFKYVCNCWKYVMNKSLYFNEERWNPILDEFYSSPTCKVMMKKKCENHVKLLDTPLLFW